LKEKQEQVVVLGAVSEELLASLYRRSWACVVPSVAEGYGYPALEAVRFGRPVICRPLPSLQEIMVNLQKHNQRPPRFVFADDFTISALREALLFFAEGARKNNLDGGEGDIPTMLADFFSARRMAEDTLTIYKEAIYG
jgi:glycosyltransferase involved in cell wall biosynthesis